MSSDSPKSMANYTLTIEADSGYTSTTEGRCDANQYTRAMAALHGSMTADERQLRQLLAVRVGIPGTYYDDGEAHGTEHGISIDFMRDSVSDIDAKLRALNMARAACSSADEFEVRADGKRVRRDRWEVGIRRCVSILFGDRYEFEIDEVVEAVRTMATMYRQDPIAFSEGTSLASPPEPDAWLFICWKPGKSSVFASVAPEGSEGWPWDEWQSVERIALVKGGSREQLWPKRVE